MVIVPFQDGDLCELNEINHLFYIEMPAFFVYFSIKQLIDLKNIHFNFLSRVHQHVTKLDLNDDKHVFF